MVRSVVLLLSIQILASGQDNVPDPKKYALGWTFQVGQTREHRSDGGRDTRPRSGRGRRPDPARPHRPPEEAELIPCRD